MKNILIGGAWPYANGSLHIGHIAALLPGDILARYHRLKGDRVFYVSGSDCYGTPITIRASRENTTPEKISEHYHKEFCEVFSALGFSYDNYSKTSCENHREFVTAFHKKLYSGKYTEERTVNQAYCPTCQKILTDRQATGICPRCGSSARGDGCDNCGEILEPDILLNTKCSECGTSVIFKESKQIFLLISKFRNDLTSFLSSHPYWRKNTVAFTKRYIDEGLRDRAITRDLNWGIDVPLSGYENKKIYIWAENVLGYLSAAEALCEERGTSLKELFSSDSRHYYVHGKDNIPFHTIILPSLLLAHGEYIHLPDEIISSEYMTLEGRKISTSENHAVWAKDLINDFEPDIIRYFFIANGPEKRDSDFSFREFKTQTNSELVGAWGNLVNRTLVFCQKYLDSELPKTEIDEDIRKKIQFTLLSMGEKIEKGCFRDALDEIFALIRFSNAYYDEGKPWITRTTDINACKKTIANCVYLIGNISLLLSPFLPFSSKKIASLLCLSQKWEPTEITNDRITENISVLFKKID
ncbi:MAG: methionine--tRNA ligase [Clostridia bacterium]|nr:methionine--tRNA ligase [Clostridia bacterium]